MVTKTLVATGSKEEVFSHHCPAPAGVHIMQGYGDGAMRTSENFKNRKFGEFSCYQVRCTVSVRLP